MNKTLSDIELYDLMPPSIRNDGKIIALCKSVQFDLNDLQSLLKYSHLYANIDTLPESILKFLAWECGVYGAEWFLAKTIEKRRELIKNSFLLNKLRGTRWAVERVFQLIGWRVEITEWFDEDAEPYTFRVSLLDVTGVGLSEEELKWVDALMIAYKPVSRHIKGINLVNREKPIETRVKIGFYMNLTVRL